MIEPRRFFRVDAKEAQGGDGLTEFGRVAERLRIELIHAATPQAKGRVERANQTLQDRLIKEIRLAGVSFIDEAQAFADGFLGRVRHGPRRARQELSNTRLPPRTGLRILVNLT